jgi:ribonucleoside-diphosphate reductase beta chain
MTEISISSKTSEENDIVTLTVNNNHPSGINSKEDLIKLNDVKKTLKKNILKKREVYAPFEYQKAYQYWEMQQQAHWLHSEIAMASDINDWNFKLTPSEKNLIGMTLKGFTQTEIIVNEYWSQKVFNFFPKPEIVMMAMAFANMETIHTKAYSYLNESLGIEDYEAFLYEPTAKAKIDRLLDIKGNKKEDIAKSLAVFSAFTEGVTLFSSFAILMSFSRFNKLKGVGQIVNFSVKDESLHSEAGCWLFRTLVAEHPEIMTDELKKELYQAGRDTYELEEQFIDRAFALGDIEGLTAYDLKHFIKNRVNVKLGDIGLKANYEDIDQEALKRMEWFDFMTIGVAHTDFFASRVTDYSKAVHTKDEWDEI